MTIPSTLRIGVLLVPPVQLLDVGPVDLFSMLTKDYLQACQLPIPLANLGIPASITYIALSGPGTTASLTADAGLAITASPSSPSVAPGTLDILLIPGPDPSIVPEEEVLEFVRRHVDAGVTLMTICTGVFVAGYAGVLDGKRASGPRALVGMVLEKKFPKTEWVTKRWAVDGNLWTSGGITNGQDMVASYIKQRWPGPLSETVCAMADVGEREQYYKTSQARENVWFVWQIVKAWSGIGKAKRS